MPQLQRNKHKHFEVFLAESGQHTCLLHFHVKHCVCKFWGNRLQNFIPFLLKILSNTRDSKNTYFYVYKHHSSQSNNCRFLAEICIESSKSLVAVLCFAARGFPRANKNMP